MIQKYQLRNGIKVLLIPTHKAPVVSVQTWVNTGSADEGKGEEGISHFIEHLLFKGTDKYKVGEIASIVESSGGELNAYTSFDQTVFYVTISKNFTDVAFDTVSQMMGSPKFDESEIDNEREVVIEEIKRSFDSPHRMSSRLLFSTSYQKHPYRLPVLGFDENIKKVSSKTLKNYFHSRYVPQNMIVVVTGDFNESEIKNKVDKYFGGFKKYSLRKVKRPIESDQNQARVVVEKSSFKETFLNFSWHIPGVKHKDIPALDLLSVVLGTGESSRLFKAMRLERNLVSSIGSGAFTPKDKGLFYISAQLDSKNLSETLEMIGEEITSVWMNPISEEEISKAKLILESEDFYSMETVGGLARKYGNYEQLLGDVNYFEKYIALLNKVTSAQLTEVARKYLEPKKANISALVNEEPAEIQKKLHSWVERLNDVSELVHREPLTKQKLKIGGERLQFHSKTTKSEVKTITLDNGAKIFLYPNFDTPTVSVKMAFLGGLKVEPDGKGGVLDLLSSTWTTGTDKRSEREINEMFDSSASGVGAFSGRNTVGLSLTTLSPFIDRTLDATFEILKSPSFEPAIIAREKEV
ncbi:MAG: insulinase family protein, partial [Bdellovibrionales bacterium]|nr:insulinase family protein [Bdellovibrionales bacterium]